MKKLLEFGRKAMFYVRVLSGYEERRIRSLRIQFNQRIQEAQQRKIDMRKIPEQVILSEVRRMVEEMQTLNKKLEDTEAAIDDYFKPLDKDAQIMMEMQLRGEEMKMKTEMEGVYKVLEERVEKAEKEASVEGKLTSGEEGNEQKASSSSS